MICPKCKFEQPDDVYCALCGVSVEKYARQKRRKQYRNYLLIAAAGIVVLSVAGYIKSVRQSEGPAPSPGLMDEANRSGKGKSTTLSTDSSSRPPRGREVVGRSTDRSPARSPRREGLAAERDGEKPSVSDQSPVEASLDDQQAEPRRDFDEGVLTATDWFERGRNMDDESEAEVECYQKALALDSEFAPAHYRLGAIYHRQANYDLADEAFADFLKYASEEDRQAYSIYVYYSPSDIARLSPKKEEEPIAAEAEKKEAEGEEEDYSEEKDAVSETEAGEETSEGEGEAESEESGNEEATGNVLTIVRFLPVDGHIMVPVVMNDRIEAKVLVDTGSSITVVSRELAGRLRLHEEPGHGITLKTMAVDVQADLARLDSIQLGDLRHNNFRVAIADLALGEAKDFDGILGMDFMQKYRIDINNVNRTIVFGSGR